MCLNGPDFKRETKDGDKCPCAIEVGRARGGVIRTEAQPNKSNGHAAQGSGLCLRSTRTGRCAVGVTGWVVHCGRHVCPYSPLPVAPQDTECDYGYIRDKSGNCTLIPNDKMPQVGAHAAVAPDALPAALSRSRC